LGELVVGTPALRTAVRISLPLDLVSVCSLLYRAVPGSGLDPWLVETRRAMSPEVRADLDLLHGFSGRLLYYMEEPVMAFEPLREDQADAGFEDLMEFLEELPPAAYLDMARHAIARVHRDLDYDATVPVDQDEIAWRRFLEPGLTTATAGEVMPLVMQPGELRDRTVRLYRGVWEGHYADEFKQWLPATRRAVELARSVEARGFSLAFSDLTGNRLPATLLAGLNTVSSVTFCPSAHVGSFVSYILYPPDLIVFFSVPALEARTAGEAFPPPTRVEPRSDGNAPTLDETALLDALRALSDPARLRIMDSLRRGELYAQEIVARLDVAQSAVSRHLAQLERAGLVTVRPGRGVKYYAINASRLQAVAVAIASRVQSNDVVTADDAAD
jgi:DNA-binding transcriptional ArsR family regulator